MVSAEKRGEYSEARCKARNKANKKRTERDVVRLQLLGRGRVGVREDCADTRVFVRVVLEGLSAGWLERRMLTDRGEGLARGGEGAVVHAGDLGAEACGQCGLAQ